MTLHSFCKPVKKMLFPRTEKCPHLYVCVYCVLLRLRHVHIYQTLQPLSQREGLCLQTDVFWFWPSQERVQFLISQDTTLLHYYSINVIDWVFKKCSVSLSGPEDAPFLPSIIIRIMNIPQGLCLCVVWWLGYLRPGIKLSPRLYFVYWGRDEYSVQVITHAYRVDSSL